MTVLMGLCCVPTSLRAQNFKKVELQVPALSNSVADWVDFNNDNRLDLFLAGVDASGSAHTAVYLNAGDTSFNAILLKPMFRPVHGLHDLNRDGFIDILMCGEATSGEQIIRLFINVEGRSFSESPLAVEPLTGGSLLWEDLDADGDADIILTGFNQDDDPETLVCQRTEAGYLAIEDELPSVSGGALCALDANLDGKLEIFMSGLDARGNVVSSVQSIYNGMHTSLYTESIPFTAMNRVAAMDLNADGFDDLVIAGIDGSLLRKATWVLESNGVNGFVTRASLFEAIDKAIISVADLDGDGDNDCLLSGLDLDSKTVVSYYRNLSPFHFESAPHSLIPIYNGAAAIGDMDGDTDLDVYETGMSAGGPLSGLFLSDLADTLTNSPPQPPVNLRASSDRDVVLLSWDLPDQRLAIPLTFNVYIRPENDSGGFVVSPMSDLESGFRRLVRRGNAGYLSSKRYAGLAEGRYYWSVQTIDNSFRGSRFAQEESFSVCYSLTLPQDTVLCYGEQIQFSAGGAADSVTWFSSKLQSVISDDQVLALQVFETDTLRVEVRKPFGCVVRDTIVVRVAPVASSGLADALTVCYGDSAMLAVAGSFRNVTWYNARGAVLSNLESLQHRAIERDTLSVWITTFDNCVSKDSIIITPQVPLTLSVGPDRAVCHGDTVLLRAFPDPVALNWRSLPEGNLVVETTVLRLAAIRKDTLVAEYADANGCISRDTVAIDVLPLPDLELEADTAVCSGHDYSVRIATAWTANSWTLGNGTVIAFNTTSLTRKAFSDETIVVRVSDLFGCSNADSIALNILPLPSVYAGPDISLCGEGEILLQSDPVYPKTLWISATTDSLLSSDWFLERHVATTDTLVLKVWDEYGCVNVDSVVVVTFPSPDVMVKGDTLVCDGSVCRFNIDGSWKNVQWLADDIVLGVDTDSISVVADSDILVALEVKDVHDCVARDSVNVRRIPLPDAGLPKAVQVCADDSVRLSASGGYKSYLWTDLMRNRLSKASELSLSPDFNIVYIDVEDANGCWSRDSVHIEKQTSPDFLLVGPESICAGDSLQLSLSSYDFRSMVWLDDSMDTVAIDTPSLHFKPGRDVSVTAAVESFGGCWAARTHSITVSELPTVDAGPDTVICNGTTFRLRANAKEAVRYQWQPGIFLDNPMSDTPLCKPSQSVVYSLKATSENGCDATDTVRIVVNVVSSVNAGEDLAVCEGDTVRLGGTPTASGGLFPLRFKWLHHNRLIASDPNPDLVPVESGLYHVVVTSGVCQAGHDSVYVEVNRSPVIETLRVTSVGFGGSVVLCASGGTEYRWSPIESLVGYTTACPTARPATTTTYTVRVSDVNLCSDTASVRVIVQNAIFVPDLFTPNGDGLNDRFLIYGTGIREMELAIFDQSGKEVFRSNDVEQMQREGWDGMLAGSPAAEDLYVWRLAGRFLNGDRLLFDGRTSGFINLLR